MNTTNTMKNIGGGNTKTPPNRTRKALSSRKWCFTLNNWTIDEKKYLITTFKEKKWKYVIGDEIGEKNTPHLQGYIEHKSPITFKYLKKLNKRWHLERAKGSTRDNYKYCSKDGSYISNIELTLTQDEMKELILKAEYDDVKWRPWQKNIIDILDKTPDKRKIHWRWETSGNSGKSYLAKYLALTRDVIICSGKKADVFNQVLEYVKNGRMPKIILLDVPRTSLGYINYDAIEQLKNGFMYSGKYEGGQVFIKTPHVIAFANEEPDMDSLSEDRWDIIEIN